VRGPGRGEGDHLGHVVGPERGEPAVDVRRLLLVAAEPDHGELGLDKAGQHLGQAHRLPEQLVAQGPVGHRLGVLRGAVPGAVVVDLRAGDGGDRDDMAVARGDERGQQGLGHAQRAERGPPAARRARPRSPTPASARAVAAPIPELAPVTTATGRSVPGEAVMCRA
jgi:hypothetical protein